MILVEIVLAPILKPKKGSGIVRYNCFTKITVAVYEANELRNIFRRICQRTPFRRHDLHRDFRYQIND